MNSISQQKELGIQMPETLGVESSDLKKTRLLMKSAVTTNPQNPAGWLAAARIEELDGRIEEARNIIAQGCNECQGSDDLWMEAARLAQSDQSKAILAKAVSLQPKSPKLWLACANKETDEVAKRKVLRKAIEFVPTSSSLWKEAIKLESPDEAKQLLRRAVECVPFCVDMWLALAKLEPYDEAKKVLNRARAAVPTDVKIWIHAAMLEEAQAGSQSTVDIMIGKARSALNIAGVSVTRETWLKEAIAAEESGSILTCRAIIKNIMTINLDKDDYLRIWLQNTTEAVQKGAIETARAIYKEATQILPHEEQLWMTAFEFEKENGKMEDVMKMMETALELNKQKTIYWLVYAKQLWINGELTKCRDTLLKAREAHSKDEQILLALVKFERQNKNVDGAKEALQWGRDHIKSEKIYKNSIELHYFLKDISSANKLLDQALFLFPKSQKLLLLGIRLALHEKDYEKARNCLGKAVSCLGSRTPELALIAAEIETSQRLYPQARTILQESRINFPKNDKLWLASVKLEVISGNTKIASNLVARGLQECPHSGSLWSEAIIIEQHALRKTKSVDALEACDRDAKVVLACAKMFWADEKYEKARKWMKAAVEYDPLFGDAWAYYYKFEKSLGKKEQAEEIKRKCCHTQPRKGDRWKETAKDIMNWMDTTEEILEKVAAKIDVNGS